MTTPTAYRREILNYLKNSYGVADAEVYKAPHGGHRRVRFTYNGKLHALTIHDHQNNLGGQALNMKLQDIRRTLGPPPVVPAITATKQARQAMPLPQPETPAMDVLVTTQAFDLPHPGEINKTQGFTETPTSTSQSYTGVCSLVTPPSSPNARLRFVIPSELFQAFRHTGSCSITRLDSETFEIKPKAGTFKTPRCFLEPASGKYELISETVVPKTPDIVIWGASPAEYQLVDGHIMVLCPVATRRVPKASGGRRPKVTIADIADIVGGSVGVVDPARGTQFAAPRSIPQQTFETSLDEATMKTILTTIKRIEDASPYRLVKLSEGGWAWRAPTIKLE